MLNWKKYLIGSIVVFVAYTAAGYLIHEVLLASAYRQEEVVRLLRPEAEIWKRMPLGYFANLVLALVFCYIYTRGVEAGKHWLGQGVRYGLLMATLVSLPTALLQYMLYPLPLALAFQWIVYGYGQMLVAGIVVAAIYRLPTGLPRP